MRIELALCQRAGEELNQNLTPNNEIGMNIVAEGRWSGTVNLTPKYEVGTSFVAEGGWSGTLQILINNKFLLRKAFDIL